MKKRKKQKLIPAIVRFFGHVCITETCWNWIGSKESKGYGRFVVRIKKYGGRKFLAHRFIWEFCHGKIPKDMCVLHKCDNPSCIKPEHLFIGTNMDNTIDKIKKNRHCFGERLWTAKLKENEVLEIRELCVFGISFKEIAKAYGMGSTAIKSIHDRDSWRYLEKNTPKKLSWSRTLEKVSGHQETN